MGLRLGQTAPDFEANTTEGRIRFHEWIGDSWVVLFSHPKDFTPVCTTELGYMAKLKSEFDKRNTKIIGLSVDPVDNHAKWAVDIKETQGFAPNYPMIGDRELSVAKLSANARLLLPAGRSATTTVNVSDLGVGRRGRDDVRAVRYQPREHRRHGDRAAVAVLDVAADGVDGRAIGQIEDTGCRHIVSSARACPLRQIELPGVDRDGSTLIVEREVDVRY